VTGSITLAHGASGGLDMATRVEQTGSFIATDERGGRHWLLVFTEYVRVPSTGKGGAKEKEGATCIRTSEGKHVERQGKGKYKIMETGIVLTSDDPDAI
jgi:hypothetical protein